MFIDLRKAFDKVNHDNLLMKLEYYGFRGPPWELIRSYLKNRQQAVRVNSSVSSHRIIPMGLPQGSIIGPLLFYIISMIFR